MLRFVKNQVRWAGIAVQASGLLFSNTYLLWAGTIIFFGSFLWAHCILEEMYMAIEIEANNENKEKEDHK